MALDKDNIFANEDCVAFFSFELFEPRLSGICKVARPIQREGYNYLALTLIADTNKTPQHTQFEQALRKLTLESIQKHLPEVQAVTALPLNLAQGVHHVHQLDLKFPPEAQLEPKAIVPKVVFVLRNQVGCKTEAPQYWGS